MRKVPSPNFNDRPDGVEVDTVVIHYTGMKTAEEALACMCDPEAEVSAHYMIYEDGDVVQLVAEDKRAWHAGVSFWDGRENVNDFSIGIELVNKGHEFGYHEFPNEQMEALIELLRGIKSRHRIKKGNIIGHSDVAPERKQDPGELFDWGMLEVIERD